MKYYMMSVNDNDNGNTLYLGVKETIKDAKSSIQWMRQGGFEDDYRVVKRISKLEFQDVETKEIFKIDENDPKGYTKKAWSELINDFN